MAAIADSGAELPAVWKGAVLTCYLQEALQRQDWSAEEFMELAGQCVPCSGAKESFSTEKPAMSGITDLSSTEMGALVTKTILDLLLPMIEKGASCAEKILCFCKALQERFKDFPSSCPILRAAASEVQLMCSCIVSLADRGAAVADQTAVSTVFDSRAGVKHMLRLSLQQNAWFRAQEAHFRSTFSASQTLIPELKKVLSALEGDTSWNGVEQGSQQLTVWRNSLRPGATQVVEAALKTALEAAFLKAVEDKDV